MSSASHNFKKRFGQNFLSDPAYIHRIVHSISPQNTDDVIEIGPGAGALTQHIASNVNSLKLIELDRDLIESLKTNFANDNNKVEIINEDVLKVDFNKIVNNGLSRVIGNLPYNISTPLLFHLFDHIHLFKDMYFMLQKEVAERLASPSGSKKYGRLSVISQCYCDIEVLFFVPNTAFNPRPKVESAIVRLVPNNRVKTQNINTDLLNNIVTKAFSYRRKTVLNSLKDLVTESVLLDVGINPKLRPEDLSVDDYIKLSKTLDEGGKA